jgi:hypothetical protein
VWIQCVQHDDKYSPNPNGLFIRKGKGRLSPEVLDDGYGKGTHPVLEKDGVVKLHFEDVSQNDGKIIFGEPFQLALFRTTNKNAFDKLEIRNQSNSNTPDGTQRLRQATIYTDTKCKAAREYLDKVDTTYVRLCFQVFLKRHVVGADGAEATMIEGLDPVFSEIIQDCHAHPRPKICDLSSNFASENGGDKIILLCNKIDEHKDDKQDKIEIKFTFSNLSDKQGNAIQTTGAFKASDVHHQFAIKFTTPAYPAKLDPSSHVHAKVQLYKPPELLPDGRPSELKPKYSEPWDFIYFPTKMVQDKHSKCIGKWGETPCQYAIKEKSSTSTSKTPQLTGNKTHRYTPTMYTLNSAEDMGHIIVPKQRTKRTNVNVGHAGNTDPALRSGPLQNKQSKEKESTANINTGKICDEILAMEDAKNPNKNE